MATAAALIGQDLLQFDCLIFSTRFGSSVGVRGELRARRQDDRRGDVRHRRQVHRRAQD